MEKSMNSYFSKLYNGKETSFEKRISDIKNANFDCVGIYLHKEKISMLEQNDICSKYGLKICYIHSDYGNEKLLNNFWLDNNFGDEIEKSYTEQIKECIGVNCNNIVFHLCGSYKAQIGEIGLNRIRRLVSLCEKYNFNFCIENTFRPDKFKYIFDNIKSDNLKICFDAGHEFCLTPSAKILEKFANKVSCTHLHDNCGKIYSPLTHTPSAISDQHKILGDGKINIDKLAKRLSLINENVPLNMEFKTINRITDSNGDFINIDLGYNETSLKKVYASLKMLEKKIKKYKK